jgi:hypothetical protein
MGSVDGGAVETLMASSICDARGSRARNAMALAVLTRCLFGTADRSRAADYSGSLWEGLSGRLV